MNNFSLATFLKSRAPSAPRSRLLHSDGTDPPVRLTGPVAALEVWNRNLELRKFAPRPWL